jgi:hypothetical protein
VFTGGDGYLWLQLRADLGTPEAERVAAQVRRLFVLAEDALPEALQRQPVATNRSEWPGGTAGHVRRPMQTDEDAKSPTGGRYVRLVASKSSLERDLAPARLGAGREAVVTRVDGYRREEPVMPPPRPVVR